MLTPLQILPVTVLTLESVLCPIKQGCFVQTSRARFLQAQKQWAVRQCFIFFPGKGTINQSNRFSLCVVRCDWWEGFRDLFVFIVCPLSADCLPRSNLHHLHQATECECPEWTGTKMITMADESPAVPVWCDVGVNLNAVSFVISLGCFTKGTITCGPKSKLIVRICSRELSCCCYRTDDNTWRALENTVQLPGNKVRLRFFQRSFRLQGKLFKWKQLLQYDYTNRGHPHKNWDIFKISQSQVEI